MNSIDTKIQIIGEIAELDCGFKKIRTQMSFLAPAGQLEALAGSNLDHLSVQLQDLQARVQGLFENAIGEVSSEISEEELLEFVTNLSEAASVLESIQKHQEGAAQCLELAEDVDAFISNIDRSMGTEALSSLRGRVSNLRENLDLNQGNRNFVDQLENRLGSGEQAISRWRSREIAEQDLEFQAGLFADQFKGIKQQLTNEPRRDFERVLLFYDKIKRHRDGNTGPEAESFQIAMNSLLAKVEDLLTNICQAQENQEREQAQKNEEHKQQASSINNVLRALANEDESAIKDAYALLGSDLKEKFREALSTCAGRQIPRTLLSSQFSLSDLPGTLEQKKEALKQVLSSIPQQVKVANRAEEMQRRLSNAIQGIREEICPFSLIPSEVTMLILANVVSDLTPRLVCQEWDAVIFEIYKDRWNHLIQCPPEGPIELQKQMAIVEAGQSDYPPYFSFSRRLRKLVETTFGITVQPSCLLSHSQLSGMQGRVNEISLETIWPYIASHMDLFDHFNPLDAIAIRSWLACPDNNRLLDRIDDIYYPNGNLRAISPEFGRFTKLRQLRLHANRITFLPHEIGNLTNLTRLNLCRNHLASLPTELVNLTQLQQLFLAENQFKVFPCEILNLPNLTELDMEGNPLESIPDEVLCSTKKVFAENPTIVAFKQKLNLEQELNYHGFSPLAMLYGVMIDHMNEEENQFACEEEEEDGSYIEDMSSALEDLTDQDRTFLLGSLCRLHGRAVDVEWAESHAFENEAFFLNALRQTIIKKYDQLPAEMRRKVDAKVHELAGSPAPEDLEWGTLHAKDNLPRLADAMEHCQ